MDYKVVAVHQNGAVDTRTCATYTDVENFIVQRLRIARDEKSPLPSFQVISWN